MSFKSGVVYARPMTAFATVMFAWTAAVTLAAAPSGLDFAAVDRSVAPGDDFFRFANGRWLATTEIPADRSNYGTGAVVSDLTEQRTAQLIDSAIKAAHDPKGGSDKLFANDEARKVGDYYATFMDEEAIEKK